MRRFLLLSRCLIIVLLLSSQISGHAQIDQVEVEHDTVKARRYFERGMELKDDLESDSAAYYFEEAAELYEFNLSWLKAVKVNIELQEVLVHRKKELQSLTVIGKSLKIVNRYLRGETEILAKLYHRKGNCYIPIGNYDSAEYWIMEALKVPIKDKTRSLSTFAYCHYSLGWLHMQKNEFDKAIYNVNESINLNKELADIDGLAKSLNVSAALYYFKADYSTAKQQWEKGLSISTGRDKYTILANLGNIYFQERNFVRAFTNYVKVLEWEKSYYKEENHSIALSLFNIAEVLEEQNKFLESARYFKESLRIYRKSVGDEHPEIIEVYEKLGGVYWELEDRKEALRYFGQALDISERNLDVIEIKAALFGKLGAIHLEESQIDSAEDYFNRSLSTLEMIFGMKHPKIAESYLKIAALRKSQSNWRQVLESCTKALYSVTQEGGDLNQLKPVNVRFTTKGIDVLSTYAEYLTDAYLDNYGSKKSLVKALSYVELAIELVQQKRILVFDQEAQKDFSERYVGVYREGLRIALLLYDETNDSKYLNIAYEMMEGSKAFTLNQSNQDRQEPIEYAIPDSLLERERSLKVDISFYQEEILNRKSGLKGYDTTLVKNFEDKLFYRKRNFEQLKQKLENDFPKYHQLKYHNNTIDLSTLQRNLAENELPIEYLWQEDRVVLIGVTKHKVVYEEVSIDQVLLDQITSINNAFNNPESTLLVDGFVELSNAVFNKLIAPALSIAGSNTSKLIIIPDGPLTQMNFDLLVQHQRDSDTEWKDLSYLIKDYAIATGYSATLFFEDKPEVQNTSNDLLAFSFGEQDVIIDGGHLALNRVRSADLRSLPGSAKEIKTIADLVDGDYYYGQQANEQTFKEVASDYQVLHLALHGSVNEENPDFSKLHLHTSDSSEDGRLHVYELYNMELNADLAVLSACNTGSGKYQTGEGIMSLGHAFSYAGVNSLLLTRWDLSDEAAPELMRVFYKELKKGKSKSEALRTAKLEYLENASMFRSNPFYWGSFFVLGDDSPVEFNDSNAKFYWLGGLMLLLLMSLLILKSYRHRQIFSKQLGVSD